MKPLRHIDFETIGQAAWVVPVEEVVRPDGLKNVSSVPNQCHRNAVINAQLVSVWDTPIEYVEGYACNGYVEHAFNRAIDDNGEYHYFDATTGAQSEYYYALRAFSADQISAVADYYGETFLTFAHNHIAAFAPYPFSYDELGELVKESMDTIMGRGKRQKETVQILENLNKK